MLTNALNSAITIRQFEIPEEPYIILLLPRRAQIRVLRSNERKRGARYAAGELGVGRI